MILMRSRIFAATLALRRRFGVTADVFNAVRTLAGGKRRRFPPMLPFIRLIHWFAGFYLCRCGPRPAERPKEITVTFREPSGKDHVVKAKIGLSMLDVAQDNHVDIEGACGGEAACSTCHVILDQAYFDKLSKPSEEELDMLDLAAGLTKTCAVP